MEVQCIMCKNYLSQPGALVFSPPVYNTINSTVTKYHICYVCWMKLRRFLESDS